MVQLDWFKLKKKRKHCYLRTSIPFFHRTLLFFSGKEYYRRPKISYVTNHIQLTKWGPAGAVVISKYLLKFTNQCCSFYSSYTFFFLFLFWNSKFDLLKKHVIKRITFLYQELDICSKVFFWQLVKAGVNRSNIHIQHIL